MSDQNSIAIVIACMSLGISFISCIGMAFGKNQRVSPLLIQRIAALEKRHAVVWAASVANANDRWVRQYKAPAEVLVQE